MERPRSITFYAVVNIILGVLGVLGFAVYLVQRLGLVSMPGSEHDPTAQLMRDNAAYRWFNDIVNNLGIVAAVVCLAGAVGMLMLRPWARLATMAWGAYALCMTALGWALNHVLILQPMYEQADETQRPGLMAGIIFSACFSLVMIAYLLTMLLMLSRRSTARAFEQAHEEAAT